MLPKVLTKTISSTLDNNKCKALPTRLTKRTPTYLEIA